MDNKKNLFFVLSIIFLVGGIVFFGRGYIQKGLKETGDIKKIHIITSFYPLAYFARVVGGNNVSVQNLTPLGAEPHDFEPSPRDIASLEKTDLFIYNGASFEPWVKRWLQTQASSSLDRSIDMVSRMGEGGEVFLYKGNAVDPHIWLDPLIAQKEVIVIRDTLIRLDPLHQEEYRSNAEDLIRKLVSLDLHFKEVLNSCALREIIVSHDAFGYLARRYGLSVTPIAGISPDEEPPPQELARIISLARERKIHHIFFETTANPKFAKTIAREDGLGLLVLNPIESLTRNEVQSGEDYVSLMMENLNNLKIALSCNY